jgi:hypothetical protein
MKFYVALLVLKGLLLACGTEELDNTDQQEVINPTPPYPIPIPALSRK